MQLISFSQIADFWACPKLYEYRQVLKYPGLKRNTQARIQGKWLHQQFHLHALGHEVPLAQDPSYAELWQHYLNEIAAYADWQCHSEWSCHIPWKPNESIWLFGRIDRLYIKDREIVLLDFKTGESQSELQTLQIKFYATLLWQTRSVLDVPELEQIRARVLNLNQGKATELVFTAHTIQQAEQELEPLLQALSHKKSERYYPAPRSAQGQPWCTMCEYQGLCLEGRNYA